MIDVILIIEFTIKKGIAYMRLQEQSLSLTMNNNDLDLVIILRLSDTFYLSQFFQFHVCERNSEKKYLNGEKLQITHSKHNYQKVIYINKVESSETYGRSKELIL